MNERLITELAVFLLTLALTFAAVGVARLQAKRGQEDEDLAGRNLNRWLIGLSAGTTGNSGFIVTGAVGLGYAGGVHWLLLPLSWLIGDLVFWSLFPARLNELARQARATTLSEMLTFKLSGKSVKVISATVSLLLIGFLTTYTSAQWLAGKKFFAGVFEFSDVVALTAFSIIIVIYSSVGGFRGSVYADCVQAVIRIAGTVLALAGVGWFAMQDSEGFLRNIAQASPNFLSPFSNGSYIATVGFVAGYAFAAVGFGLGQPQIVSRYLAGRSPEETRSARWIYIGFLQFTWIAMTAFGILLRGVMPGIVDPETGLSLFFQTHMGPIVTGLIFGDVFATIASTSNGLLVAISQTLRHDLIAGAFGRPALSLAASNATTMLVGIITIALTFILPGSVFSIIVSALSKLGAGLAGPVMIKVFGWHHTSGSLLASIISGILFAFAWSSFGYSGFFNEAGVGVVASLAMNFLIASLAQFLRRKTPRLD